MIIEEQTIDADFRNDAATSLLNECDIVITNPPFSLFRVFFDWIMAANKQFLIMGTLSACTYKNVFPYIKDDLCWLGVTNRCMSFKLPDTADKYQDIIDGVKYSKLSNAAWYTNLPRPPFPPMELKTQAELEAEGVVFRHYDNYDAIEIPKCKWIPRDYSEERIVDEAELERLRAAGYTVEILEVIEDDEEVPG